MISQWLAFPAVIVLTLTSIFLIVNWKWRWNVIVLAVQTLMMFILISMVWSLGMAVVKLVVGWMVCAILGTAQPPEEQASIGIHLSDRIYRLLACGFVAVIVYSFAPQVSAVIPTNNNILWGGLTLIGMGILQLGMSTRSERVILGLLTTLSGFEILYAAVETSILVTGLLALINLGFSLVGAYLLAEPIMIEEFE